MIIKNYIQIENFRIYDWENKPVGDFKYPKGYRMATFQEFIELINLGKYKLEIWEYYWTKHFLKSQSDKDFCLSRVCLGRGGYVDSDGGDLSDSGDGGRVVCVKEYLKNEKN